MANHGPLTAVAGCSERAVLASLESFYQARGAALLPAPADAQPGGLVLRVVDSESGHLTIRGWTDPQLQAEITGHLSAALAVSAVHCRIESGRPRYEVFEDGRSRGASGALAATWGALAPDPEDEVRQWIVVPRADAPITTRMALAQLVGALLELERRSARDRVVSILRARDEQQRAHALLCEALLGQDADPVACARAIADLAVERATEDLLPLLADERWQARLHVAVALVRLGERAHAMPVLEGFLLDPAGPASRQLTAVIAIGHYGEARQLPLLAEAATLHDDPRIQQALEQARQLLGPDAG